MEGSSGWEVWYFVMQWLHIIRLFFPRLTHLKLRGFVDQTVRKKTKPSIAKLIAKYWRQSQNVWNETNIFQTTTKPRKQTSDNPQIKKRHRGQSNCCQTWTTKKFIINSEILYYFFPPWWHMKKNIKKGPPRVRGEFQIFVYPKSYFLCDLKLHAKFHNPRTTPSGRKEKERKKKNTKYSGHFISQQRPRAANTLRPWALLRNDTLKHNIRFQLVH
jgi:hypothetical protein